MNWKCFPKKTHWKWNELRQYVTVENVIWHLSDVDLSITPIKCNWKIILNHDASTNVSKTFMWRKYQTDQAKICDYLKKWKEKSIWTILKIDKHFDIVILHDTGLEKIINHEVYLNHLIGGN